jgi:hypothetical protein
MDVGVPEIEPVLALRVSPGGRDGEIEYPFELIAPPELTGLIVKIAFPTVTDCTELEIDMEGAAIGALTLNLNVATEVPAIPVAVNE